MSSEFKRQTISVRPDLYFVIGLLTKDILLHHPRQNFDIFRKIFENVNYFPAMIWKGKYIKVNGKDLRGHCYVLQIRKHLYIYIYICNILTFDPAVHQGTGASSRRYQGITLTVDGLNCVRMWRPQEASGCQTII